MSWTSDELARVGDAQELDLSVAGRTVTIWVVRVGDELYVRSWRGGRGSWFRRDQQTHTVHLHAGGVDRAVALVDAGDDINDLVDDAYRAKYARYLDSYTAHMVAPDARTTTLKLVPNTIERTSDAH